MYRRRPLHVGACHFRLTQWDGRGVQFVQGVTNSKCFHPFSVFVFTVGLLLALPFVFLPCRLCYREIPGYPLSF